MALMRNHLAVVSVWTVAAPGAAWAGWTPGPLVSGILTPGRFHIDAADEVDEVAHIFLGEPVVDPRRHGSALHAVEDGIEETAVGNPIDKPTVAQVARVGQNVERVRTLAVRLAAVAAGAALQEDALAACDGLRAAGHRVLLRQLARLQFPAWLLRERLRHVVQHTV